MYLLIAYIHALLQSPSPTNTFGQLNNKGYAEGFIIPYYSHQAHTQQEFHQTVPPPLRPNHFGLSKNFMVQRQKAGNQQRPPATRPPVTQQPER